MTGQRLSFVPALGRQHTPSVGDNPVNRQNSSGKTRSQLDFEPCLQARPLLALSKKPHPLANLSQRQNAQIEQPFVYGLYPVDDVPPSEGPCSTSG